MPDEIIKTDEQLANEFVEEYKALCDKHGFILNAVPTWKQSMDTGDWRLVVQVGVQKMPKK